jgi:hypothetical protein
VPLSAEHSEGGAALRDFPRHPSCAHTARGFLRVVEPALRKRIGYRSTAVRRHAIAITAVLAHLRIFTFQGEAAGSLQTSDGAIAQSRDRSIYLSACGLLMPSTSEATRALSRLLA